MLAILWSMFFCTCVFSQVLYFNPKMEAACLELPPSCYINNSALWIPAEVPNEQTNLVVNSSRPIQVILGPQNTGKYNLTISTLTVTGNAIVTIEGLLLILYTSNSESSITLCDNSTLQFSGTGTVYGDFLFQNDTSTLIMKDFPQVYISTYYNSLQASIMMYGGIVYLGESKSEIPLNLMYIKTGYIQFSGSINSVYVGEFGYLDGNYQPVTILQTGYFEGGAENFYAGNNSNVVINATGYVGAITIDDNATVHWISDVINDTSIFMYKFAIMYVEAIGDGPFAIMCGEFGTTVVQNAKGNSDPIVLQCGGDSQWSKYDGELVLLGNYILNANQFYPSTIKLEGSLVYVAQDLTIRATSKFPLSKGNNVSIIIPPSGSLNFENSYYVWSSLPWSMTWQPNSAISLFMSSIDFGHRLTVDEGRTIIFTTMDPSYDLISIIKADYFVVANNGKLWFQTGAQSTIMGTVYNLGTLDLTTPYPGDTFYNTYNTNVTITGNLTLYNSSVLAIPQEIYPWPYQPYGIGYINVEQKAFLTGTLNVSIGGLSIKLPTTGIDIQIMQAASISGDFHTFVYGLYQLDYNYTVSYRIQGNAVLLHLANE